MLHRLAAPSTAMPSPCALDIQPHHGWGWRFHLALPGDRAHRVAHARLFQAILAHALCCGVLTYAAALELVASACLVWMTLASLVAHGGLMAMIGNTRRLPRHDPALNAPLAGLSLAMLAGLAMSAGPARADVLAAVAPLLGLASCHVRRARECWLGAALIVVVAMVLLAMRRSGWDTEAAAWMLLGLTAVGAWRAHRGPDRLVKRLRWPVIDTWIRSADRHQRVFILHYLVGAFNCGIGVMVLNLGLYFGICHHPQVVRWLSWLAAIVIAVFYAVLRSGWNRRLADPSMTEPEIVAAISFLAVGYWLAGTSGQGVALVMLVTILMFGMFSTTPRQIGRSSLYGLFTFGVAMLAVGLTDPDMRTVHQQWIHFGMLVVILPTIFVLAAQLAQLRARLRQRKEALSLALTRIEALATRDELTGLVNRRHMLAQLAMQQQRAQRAGAPFCLCVVDIDHFKQVNDVHGHGVGDEVLAAFALAASTSLRDTDVIARWGGEEFLLMLPDADAHAASLAIERMRLAVGSNSLSSTVPSLAPTFSAGLVCCLPNEPLQQAIERADRALYQAKAEGRDCTVLG